MAEMSFYTVGIGQEYTDWAIDNDYLISSQWESPKPDKWEKYVRRMIHGEKKVGFMERVYAIMKNGN